MASVRKIADRNRKREEREARAAAGVPELRQVHASLTHGLRAALATCQRDGELAVQVWFKSTWVLRAAMRDLCAKTLKGKPLNRQACADAIRAVLTAPDGADLSSLGIGPRVPSRTALVAEPKVEPQPQGRVRRRDGAAHVPCRERLTSPWACPGMGHARRRMIPASTQGQAHGHRARRPPLHRARGAD
jgi:hypothetical protein